MEFLGVRVDKLTLEEALEGSIRLLKKPGKHLIVTTNVEFIIKAQKDQEFKRILNSSDLSIPDSARFSWASAELKAGLLKKILLWPLFFLGTIPCQEGFPVAPGVDLMEEIVAKSGENGFKIALIGGKIGVAEKAKECLLKRYPEAKIVYASDGGRVNDEGNSQDTGYRIPDTDFLFVAFGQGKQEKWIDKNQPSINAKVFMGVGGALDYLSGEVARAPHFLRKLGLEWLFRLIRQPWRFKRFLALIEFTFLILLH